MKRLIKTVLLLFLILTLSQAQMAYPEWMEVLPVICYILSFIVLVGGFYYLIKVKKVKFFTIVLGTILAFSLYTGDIQAQFLPMGDDLPDEGSDQVLESEEDFSVDNESEAQSTASEICQANESGGFNTQMLKKARSVYDWYVAKGDATTENSSFKCANDYIIMAGAISFASAQRCSPAEKLMEAMAEKDKCWPCDVTATILAGIQESVARSYNAINNAAKILLGVTYLFWLTFTILISFAKFGFEKFSEFFTKLFNQTVLVIIIAAFLHAPLVQFYKLGISPFISYTAAFAQRLSDMSYSGGIAYQSVFDKVVNELGIADTKKCSYCEKLKSGTTSDSNNYFLDSDSINSILCLTCSAYRQTAPMITIGQMMICVGRSSYTSVFENLPGITNIIDMGRASTQATTLGYILVIVFSILSFLTGYFIMASTFKLGVVFVLMPFFLVAFAYKSTREYAKKAWGLIVFAMCTILIVSLSLAFICIGFSSLMPQDSVGGFVNLFFNSDYSGLADIMSMPNVVTSGALSEDSIQKIIESSQNGEHTMKLLTMGVFAYLGIHLISSATATAEQLTSAWQINSNETQLLSSIFTQTGTKAIANSRAVFDTSKYALGKAKQTAQSAWDWFKNKMTQ